MPPTTPALLYCAVNGIDNCTNGIGRQSKTLLATLEDHHARLTATVGPFTVYLAAPAPGPATWNHNPDDLAHALRVVQRLGGRIIPLPYDTARPFWHPDTWKQLSTRAAEAAARLAERHTQVLTIAVDTPFAAVPALTTHERIDTVLALFSTSRITERPILDPAHTAWEQEAITAINQHPRAHVADIGTFLTRHLTNDYDLDPRRLTPWPSGLHLADPDLLPMPADQAAAIANRHHIPNDRPIVAAITRTDATKGLDLLIDALAPLRDDIHLAAIAVRTDDERATLFDTYQQQCRAARLNATLVGDFDRQLARALAALPATHVMACPSRGETLANVVFETGLWAQHGGAIVLAPARDGFPEQITDGHNGLLYPPDEDGALTEGLRRALALPEAERERMRRAAYARVIAERDAAGHLFALLARFFPSPGRGAGRLPGHPVPDARQPRSQATPSQLDPLEAMR
ncbi:glycosyltransferase family 4 protein [Streptomyces sp. BE20]|uniref:glycosyltransferase family 4 protein n=1 Tax=Streptomyces sp. BE20 TaxID=3002525 RepID=UPI002E761210|nr:glycosyltransferase family 4 protein [Streptomyces sp. BE20]MEE1823885.1 glycosyltransferase family 4 protein [Streptomyces sp. BE20]